MRYAESMICPSLMNNLGCDCAATLDEHGRILINRLEAGQLRPWVFEPELPDDQPLVARLQAGEVLTGKVRVEDRNILAFTQGQSVIRFRTHEDLKIQARIKRREYLDHEAFGTYLMRFASYSAVRKRQFAALTFMADVAGLRWSTAQKNVVSGLSERSNGDGMNRATVTHLVTLDDISKGRLHRKADDLLCGKNDGWWVTIDEKPGLCGDPCKGCVKNLEKFSTLSYADTLASIRQKSLDRLPDGPLQAIPFIAADRLDPDNHQHKDFLYVLTETPGADIEIDGMVALAQREINPITALALLDGAKTILAWEEDFEQVARFRR
jgi:hypothetical protein